MIGPGRRRAITASVPVVLDIVVMVVGCGRGRCNGHGLAAMEERQGSSLRLLEAISLISKAAVVAVLC